MQVDDRICWISDSLKKEGINFALILLESDLQGVPGKMAICTPTDASDFQLSDARI